MRISIYLLILVSFSAHSIECFDENFGDALEDGVKGKCQIETDLITLKAQLNSNPKSVCAKCEAKKPSTIKTRQEIFLEQSLNSLRKNMAQMTIDLMKMRSTYNLNLSAKDYMCQNKSSKEPCEAEYKCNIGEIGESCDNQYVKDGISLIQSEIANELTNMLKPSPELNPFLFKKMAFENSCNISDAQALTMQTKVAERLLAKLISEDRSDDVSSFANSNAILKNLENLKINPHIKYILENKEASKAFFGSLKKGDDVSAIMTKLYAAPLTNGFAVNQMNGCKQVISKFKEMCKDPRFTTGSIFSNNKVSLFSSSLDSNPSEIKDLTRNWCQEFAQSLKTDKASTLRSTEFESKLNPVSSVISGISHFKSESETAYDLFFNKVKATACADQKDQSSSETDKLFRAVWLDLKKEGTTEFAQLNSSDKGVNAIFASILGNVPGITKDTRKFLVEEAHILPNEKGEVVEEKAVAQRDPSYIPSKSNNSTKQPSVAGAKIDQATDTNPNASKNIEKTQTQNTNRFIANDLPEDNGTYDQSSSQSVDEAMKDPFNQNLVERLMKNRSQKAISPTAIKKGIRNQLRKHPNFEDPQFNIEEEVNNVADAYYKNAEATLEEKFSGGSGGSGSFNGPAGAGSNIQRNVVPSLEDKSMARALIAKYESQGDTAVPASKTDASGIVLKLEIDLKNIEKANIEGELTKIRDDILAKDGQKFVLKIGNYEFYVDGNEVEPKSGRMPQAILEKVQNFFKKNIPRSRVQRLSFLKTILADKTN